MLEIMKMAAMDAMETGRLADICLGVVQSVAPLSIALEEGTGLVIPERFLVLGSRLMDERIRVRFRCLETQEEREEEMVFYKSLKAGDTVILAKAAGGQMYAVLDRVAKYA